MVFNNVLVILNINKKRFECHDCRSTFTEEIPGISKHARISNNLKKAIAQDFVITKTNKDIAIKNFVSQTTVSRYSDKREYEIDYVNYEVLPEIIGIDEFKATSDTVNSMACIIIDHDTKKPFDILPSRKLEHLLKYFNKFSKEARDNVKIVTMDMYEPYVRLVNKVFKNATIVFDKFHIVQNFTRALNKTRISVMNQLETDNIYYKRLKKYWKELLSFKIKDKGYYHKLPLYEELTNISDVVKDIKESDKVLRDSHDFYQVFFFHLNKNDITSAMKVIEEHQDKVSDYMKTAISTFIKYKTYCIEAYNSIYSNALTEYIIQKIKLIKRNAYGFKSFRSFKRRILHYFATNSLRNNLTILPQTSNIKQYAASLI